MSITPQVKGGVARAKALPPERKKEIAQKAAAARWRQDLPKATHEANIIIGDLVVECAVLEDERRVISERAMTRAFGGSRGGSHWKRMKEGHIQLPVYLSAKNFSDYIDAELAEALAGRVEYRTKNGGVAHGVEAKLLPRVCNVFLKARDADALHPSQIAMAIQADIIMRGLAELGIIALIDEATGYQDSRASDALARILEQFLADEKQKWARTFPVDFYREIYRLWGWKFEPWNTKRPSVIAGWTDDFVYQRIAPGLLAELREKNPRQETGRRSAKHHQWFNPERGHPALKEHISGVIALLRAAETWEGFKRGLNRAYPKFGETMELPLTGGEGRRK